MRLSGNLWYTCTKLIEDREAMIDFGSRFGHVIESIEDHPGQWKVVATGSLNGMKSLAAFGMNKALRPNLYPNGVTRDLRAESDLKGRFCQGGVVFDDYFNQFISRPERFDAELIEFGQKNPQAKILFASNLRRFINEQKSYESEGLQSGELDVHLYFATTSGESCQVHCTFVDDRLFAAIEPDFRAIFGNRPPAPKSADHTPAAS